MISDRVTEPVFGTSGDILVVSRYLAEKTNNPEWARKTASQFGKEVKKLYIQMYGHPPRTVEIELNEKPTTVCQYTVSDKPLFERAWVELLRRKLTAAMGSARPAPTVTDGARRNG
jgi:hypothetical protein